jgi:hypothetical protein
LKEINEGRQKSNYTKLNEGILSDLDKSYLAVGRKVQKVLAETLHRLCEVAIKDKGNDLQDVKTCEEKLDIEIQIYTSEPRQIYGGAEKHVKCT